MRKYAVKKKSANGFGTLAAAWRRQDFYVLLALFFCLFTELAHRLGR